jgi:hypothetical protein
MFELGIIIFTVGFCGGVIAYSTILRKTIKKGVKGDVKSNRYL